MIELDKEEFEKFLSNYEYDNFYYEFEKSIGSDEEHDDEVEESEMTNYNNYSIKRNRKNDQVKSEIEMADMLKPIDPIVPETVEPEPEPVEPLKGVVINCQALNVREEPSMLSETFGVIKVDTEVVIDPSESTEEFYKVCAETGLEGFCMKKYISVR